MIIRKAVIKDIKAIHRILGDYGSQGLLLARPISELYDHLRDFFVVHESGHENSTLGVCALGICWEDIAEVRSLAVLREQHGKGLGRRLVETCLNEARGLGIPKIFALTYVPDFFSKLGFHEVEKSLLPHKIWADCLKCAKFPDCDETAMLIHL